jgi:Bacterial Ig-like domain
LGGNGGIGTGGGGGGYYGGGGETFGSADGSLPFWGAGGGGGGSNLVPTGGTASIATTGPSITISYPGPGDTTAPTVTTWSPTGTSSKKATGTATFSEDVQNVNTTTFKLERVIAVKKSPTKYEPVAATVTPSSGTVEQGANATLTPTLNLPSGTYRVTLTGGVTDTAGNALIPKTWSFTVRK